MATLHTFLKLIYEMIGDLLELCGVDREELLEMLDLLEKVLGDIDK